MCRILFAALAALLVASPASAAEGVPREPYGIDLEGFPYPYPVNLLPLVNDGEPLRMAYMDVGPAQPNGRVVVLLHGRNFPSSYWANAHAEVIANTGHLVFLEAREKYDALLLGFLAK